MGLAELEPTPSQSLETPQDVAFRWVADQAYYYLLETGAAANGRELLPVVNENASVGPKALKRALELDPRFQRQERRWGIVSHELDERRPIERSVVALIDAAGQPLSTSALGRQLALVYPREESALMEITERLVTNRPDFFAAGEDVIGVREWLLDASAENLEDIEFENFEDTSEIQALRPVFEQIDWSSGTLQENTLEFLNRLDRPVSNKALQLFLWQAYSRRFDAALFYRLLNEHPEIRIVSPAQWVGPALLEKAQASLHEFESSDDTVELTNEDVPKPITVEPEDVDALAEHLSELPVRTTELLSIQFPDLRPDDPNYPTTLGSLDKGIRHDERFMWVGWDRWTSPQPIPDSAKTFPEILNPVVVDIEISAGQREDIELEDEGLEGTLAQDIEDPLVKFGSSVERLDNGEIQCVLTYGHRQVGTLGIGQEGLVFPRQPEFLLVTTVDENGTTRANWVNNELGLMYNLGEWYNDMLLPESGAVFRFTPQEGTGGHYLLQTEGETHEATYLDNNRVKDLRAIRDQALAQQTSTREIIQLIMGHHSKGMTLQELYAEVIVVRMTSPRMIASILSSYYEFYSKGNTWLYNARDAGKGFKKQKKKYLIRR